METFEIPKKFTRKLNDLNSIKLDLKYSKSSLAFILNKFNSQTPTIVEIGLYRFALISFFKCFGGGVRKENLSKDLFRSLPGKPLDFLDYLKNVRDKYLAHSVNSLEEVQFGVQINGNVIVGIHTDSYNYEIDHIEKIKMFDLFIDICINYIDEKIKIELDILSKIITSLGINEMKSWPPYELRTLENHILAAKKTRPS